MAKLIPVNLPPDFPVPTDAEVRAGMEVLKRYVPSAANREYLVRKILEAARIARGGAPL